MNHYQLSHTTMTGSVLENTETTTIQAPSMLSAKQQATKWKGGRHQVSGKWKGNENESVKTRGYTLDAQLKVQLVKDTPCQQQQ